MAETATESFIFDWSRFTVQIPVYADMNKIYEVWTTQAGLESWFLSKAEFRNQENALRDIKSYAQAGDQYTFMWWGYKGPEENGKVIAANGKDLFQFSFAGECVVTITLKMIEGACIVELIQDNIPVDEKSMVNFHLGCSQGWTFYFANLKSIVDGGMDLRNKNEKLIRVINT